MTLVTQVVVTNELWLVILVPVSLVSQALLFYFHWQLSSLFGLVLSVGPVLLTLHSSIKL